MRAVDTNVLVRLIARDDAAQLKNAEAFIAQGAWVSHLVLVDTIWVLDAVMGLSRERAGMAVDMLLNHAQLTIQDTDIVKLALIRYRSRPSVGFSDCLLLETARKAGHLPLGTFDKDLARLPGAQRL
jgi:predicted nucleic-acid-binding protein